MADVVKVSALLIFAEVKLYVGADPDLGIEEKSSCRMGHIMNYVGKVFVGASSLMMARMVMRMRLH